MLFYYNDLANNTLQNSTVIETTVDKRIERMAAAQSSYYFITHSKTWNDSGISWMKAYVTAKYDSNTRKIIGDPTTDSGIYGFHPGNSWTHSFGRSTVSVNSARTGGYATIVGDLTLSIIFEGIGDITTKQLTCEMSF